MSESTTFTVRLAAGLKERLSALARTTKRSKSFLAAEAIAAYVENQEWQLRQIEAGVSDAEAGRVVSGEAVAEWLSSWGGPAELPPPPECK
jgi:predicted transcriptional regulator